MADGPLPQSNPILRLHALLVACSQVKDVTLSQFVSNYYNSSGIRSNSVAMTKMFRVIEEAYEYVRVHAPTESVSVFLRPIEGVADVLENTPSGSSINSFNQAVSPYKSMISAYGHMLAALGFSDSYHQITDDDKRTIYNSIDELIEELQKSGLDGKYVGKFVQLLNKLRSDIQMGDKVGGDDLLSDLDRLLVFLAKIEEREDAKSKSILKIGGIIATTLLTYVGYTNDLLALPQSLATIITRPALISASKVVQEAKTEDWLQPPEGPQALPPVPEE